VSWCGDQMQESIDFVNVAARPELCDLYLGPLQMYGRSESKKMYKSTNNS
jgi:hypothetical protein